MDNLITIRNLYKYFVTEAGQEVRALEDINLTVGKDDFVCIIGPSGSGKSTLLRLMEGLLSPTAGEVRVMGKPVTHPLPQASMVFQEYSLMPWRKVIDNVAFGLEIRRIPKKERYEIAANILHRFGLQEFMFSYPYELSGGMQQRAAIARALAVSPLILFMDEPFGALDAYTRFQMQQELIEFWLEEKRAVVFVTHSVEEAIYLGKRVVLMSPRPGKIAQEYHIDLPYPRDRFSGEFRTYFEEIMDHMNRVNEA